MRTRAISRFVAALSVLAVFAAACGEDDPTTTAAAQTDDIADTDAAADGGATADDAVSDDDATDDMDGDHEHDTEHDMDADHDMEGDHDMDDMHDHSDAVDFEGTDVPTIGVNVVADPAGGVNIEVLTTNYTIAPRSASTEHVEGEGHFHLYIDGEKVLRFYNEWIYFAGVTEGEVEIMVELSANDHRPYAHDGKPLYAMTTFAVPEHTHDEHSHNDPVAVEFVGDAPGISVEVLPDPKSGYNAFVEVEGIVLSGENASTDHVDGEGHLHIYVNGQKLGRLYGGATHIDALPEGDVEITVGAYSNDHMPYEVDSQPVEASTTITVG